MLRIYCFFFFDIVVFSLGAYTDRERPIEQIVNFYLSMFPLDHVFLLPICTIFSIIVELPFVAHFFGWLNSMVKMSLEGIKQINQTHTCR